MTAVSARSRVPATLVDTSRAPGPNPLIDSHVYPVRGSTDALQALPAVVHFGGFQVGKTHTMRLRIVNKGKEAFRIQILPPTTEEFSIRYTKKERFVPGMAEEVLVDFKPKEWRYHYDCIRVLAPNDQNMLIPIHGYPVVGESSIPKRIDFGRCAIAEPVVRRIPLKCSVPIDFEFRVRVLESHPAFSVSPLAGTIPAKGQTSIEVCYHPHEFATASASFEVELSQLNAKPMTCTVTGSCAPGKAKEKYVQEATLQRTLKEQAEATQMPRPESPRAKRRAGPGAASSARANSAAVDAPLATAPAASGKARGPSRPPTGSPDARRTRRNSQLSGMRTVAGIKVRERLDNIHAVNQVLNQPAHSLLELSAVAPLVTADPLERAMREEDFVKHLRSLASVPPGLGAPELSHEARRAILAERRQASEAYDYVKGLGPQVVAEAAARQTTQLDTVLTRTHRVVTGDGSQHVVFEETAAVATAKSAAQQTSEKQEDGEQGESASLAPTPVPPAAADPAAAAAPTTVLAVAPPQFHARPADMWARRAAVVDRFVQAGRTVMIRLRAKRRLRQLQQLRGLGAAGGAAGGGGDGLFDEAENEYRRPSTRILRMAHMRHSARSRESTRAVVSVTPDRIRPFDFPEHSQPRLIEVDTQRSPLPAGMPEVASAPPQYVPLHVPQEYKLLGYEEVSYTAAQMLWGPPPLVAPGKRASSSSAPGPEQRQQGQSADLHTAAMEHLVGSSTLRAVRKAIDGTDNDQADGPATAAEAKSTPASASGEEAAFVMTAPVGLLPHSTEPGPPLPASYVLNPASELYPFRAADHYGETDDDHWLAPLGLQRARPQTLGRVVADDSISGSSPGALEPVPALVAFRGQPVPSLASLTQWPHPTMANVHLPRSVELLAPLYPEDTPELLDGLPERDRLEVDVNVAADTTARHLAERGVLNLGQFGAGMNTGDPDVPVPAAARAHMRTASTVTMDSVWQQFEVPGGREATLAGVQASLSAVLQAQYGQVSALLEQRSRAVQGALGNNLLKAEVARLTYAGDGDQGGDRDGEQARREPSEVAGGGTSAEAEGGGDAAAI